MSVYEYGSPRLKAKAWQLRGSVAFVASDATASHSASQLSSVTPRSPCEPTAAMIGGRERALAMLRSSVSRWSRRRPLSVPASAISCAIASEISCDAPDRRLRRSEFFPDISLIISREVSSAARWRSRQTSLSVAAGALARNSPVRSRRSSCPMMASRADLVAAPGGGGGGEGLTIEPTKQSVAGRRSSRIRRTRRQATRSSVGALSAFSRAPPRPQTRRWAAACSPPRPGSTAAAAAAARGWEAGPACIAGLGAAPAAAAAAEEGSSERA